MKLTCSLCTAIFLWCNVCVTLLLHLILPIKYLVLSYCMYGLTRLIEIILVFVVVVWFLFCFACFISASHAFLMNHMSCVCFCFSIVNIYGLVQGKTVKQRFSNFCILRRSFNFYRFLTTKINEQVNGQINCYLFGNQYHCNKGNISITCILLF